MIEEYKFGLIVINGKTYNHDIEVLWTGEVLEWRQKERHIVDVESVKKALEKNPETIVIGMGAFGMLEITREAQKLFSEKGIKLIADKTEEATKTFNIICQAKERVIGFFHLTC